MCMCEYLILGADVFFGPKSGDTLNSWVILVFHITILYIIAVSISQQSRTQPLGSPAAVGLESPIARATSRPMASAASALEGRWMLEDDEGNTSFALISTDLEVTFVDDPVTWKNSGMNSGVSFKHD